MVKLGIAVLSASLLVLLCAASAAAAPRQGKESSGGGLEKAVGGESGREDPGGTKRKPPEEDGVAERAAKGIAGLAGRADAILTDFTGNATLGWAGAVILLGAALLLLGFGWALLRALFVPFSALIGGATGAFLAVELARVAGAGSGSGQLWGALAVGAVLGGGGAALIGARARPVGQMLVAAAPFLVISVFLFPLGAIGSLLAIGAVLVGLVLGFASMWRLRFIVICSTSLLGSICLVGALAMAVHLTGAGTLLAGLDWIVRNGWPAPLVVLLAAAAGVNFQHTFGPPEEHAAESRRRRGQAVQRGV